MNDPTDAARIDAYIAALDEPHRSMLTHLRELICSAVPEATEAIAYGIPTVRLHGRNLVHYAAFKKHCSFFPGSAALNEAFAEALKGFVIAKGTIQFTHDRPLPDDLVLRIVAFRIEEEAARARAGKRR